MLVLLLLTAVQLPIAGSEPLGDRSGVVDQGVFGGLHLLASNQTSGSVQAPLTDLPDGDWAVVVDATEPLVVAGRTTAGGASGLDIEWWVPTGALQAGQEVLTSVAPSPGGVSARLHLMAPDGDVTATVDGREVLVPAGQSVVLETAANVGVRLAADGVLHASVSYRGDGLMAGTRILPPPLAAQPVTVYP